MLSIKPLYVPLGFPKPHLRTTNVMSFVALEELYHVCRQVLDFGLDTQSLEQKVMFHLGFIIYNNIYQKKRWSNKTSYRLHFAR